MAGSMRANSHRRTRFSVRWGAGRSAPWVRAALGLWQARGLMLSACLVLLGAACASQLHAGGGPSGPAGSPETTLSVFAASSLAEPFREIGQLFEREHPGAKVIFNHAGSQQLAQQLAQGAPADVFASAGPQPMQGAVESGRVRSGVVVQFASNRLAVIYPADNPAGLRTIQDLARPGLRLVLAAPEVPAGQYALDFLDKARGDPDFGPGFPDGVLANVVSYEENVKAVVSKVALGEADAGIAYTTDVAAAGSGKIGHLDIPDRVNVLAVYSIAPIADSHEAELAKEFVRYRAFT
jgi:molybdate transport system substrate-binding protein